MTFASDAVTDLAPDTGGSQPGRGASQPRSVESLRLAAISLALTLVMFAQSTGQVAADTKLSLVIDPLRFLHRALSLWDPIAKAGELQNQAYGYLFPTGPFFIVGHWLHLAPWTTQRLWESALLVASFHGMFRLARLLGLQRFWPAVLAGLVYALSPRILGELTSISAELTPTAALPWILVPLVRGANGASPRRSAAWSGLALLFAGGTNAAATLAVLPAPALWLLTRQRGPRRRALMTYWVIAVTLASVWWAVPLLLLGRYSPPFLDWIEAAQNTTSPTSLSAVLRGVPHWEAYLGPSVWPSAWILVSSPVAILATSAVAALGSLGLSGRRVANRGFLLSSLAVGLLLVTLGHVAGVGPPFATQVRHLLDGPLAAFRNVHKFEALVRLPLAFGCGLAVDRMHVPVWWSSRKPRVELRLPSRALAVGCALVIAVAAIAPAVSGRLVSQPRAATEASWWPQAAGWLAAHSGGARALIVPGAPKPTYVWGQTIDDAMEPLAESPWIVRDSTPLYPAGLERLLMSSEQLVATGRPVPELAELLARGGIGFVVVRNDLEAVNSAATQQDIVRATLTESPGFTLATTFGPLLGGTPTRNDVFDGGAARPRPAIEIFKIVSGASTVSLMPLDHAVEANGSADNLAALVEAGLPVNRPVFFGPDAAPRDVPDALRVATDGIRRQQSSFGGTFARSATMTADQPFAGSRAAYDFLPPDPDPLSTMRYVGIRDIEASSSGSDAVARANLSPANGPWSAFDGDPSTAWRSSAPNDAVGQWLQADFDSKVSAGSVQVTFAPNLGPYPAAVRITTDTGTRIDSTESTADLQVLALPPGATTFLRITVVGVQGGGFGKAVGISTLAIDGVTPSRTLDVSAVGSPQVLNFAIAPGFRDGCVPATVGVACQDDLIARGEEDTALDRSVDLGAAASYHLSAQVSLTGSAELDRRLDADLPIKASASSTESTDPRVRPGAAVDGDNSTTWIAAPGDATPTVTLALGRREEVRGVGIETSPGAAASAATRVRIVAGPLEWTGAVPATGKIEFKRPVTTKSITIIVLEAELSRSTSIIDARRTLLPVGISTITVDDASAALAALPATITFGCDAGLSTVIDGTQVPLTLNASAADALAGRPVTAKACSRAPLTLAAGPHRLVLTQTAWARPASLNLSIPGVSLAQSQPDTGSARVTHWGATSRRVVVATTVRSALVVHENFNRGWTARVNGHTLSPVEVDGWEQAFVLPAGTTGAVVLTYAPQRSFEIGLIAGLIAALLVVAVAMFRGPACGAAALVEAKPRRVIVVAATALLAGLLAGVTGLIALVVVIGIVRFLGPGRFDLSGRLSAGAIVVAGLDVALSDPLRIFATADSDTVQLLIVGAVLLALTGGWPGGAWRGKRDP